MTSSKLLVLAGGLVGIVAFFLPLVSAHGSDRATYQVVQADQDGRVHAVTAHDPDVAASAYQILDAPEGGRLRGLVVAMFVPAVLLALLGGLGVARRRFGRGLGIASSILGVGGLAIAGLLRSAAEGDAGIGLTLLLLTGTSGAIGGLCAAIKPDRGARRDRPARATVGA